ncbi:MAG: hypothetical protein ACLR94_06700 [Acutalibacteraceae bacterium]
MTIQQVKEEAKKRFGRELTDEQAQTWLNEHATGELQDNELDDAAGGGCFPTAEELERESKCPHCGSYNIHWATGICLDCYKTIWDMFE